MLNKIMLYLSVMHKGELLKRIEYKLKDLTGYFYLKNKFCSLNKNTSYIIPNISFSNQINSDNTKEFYVFNKSITFSEIENEIKLTNQFWRNYKLSEYKNIKEIWEINRLQFLLPLSLYDKDLAIKIFNKWIVNNKYCYSINWTSNLEAAIRLINIYLFLIRLNDQELNKKYQNVLLEHATYVYNEIDYSKACIPNNHLIGEATALLIAGNIFNNNKWINKANKILKEYQSIINDDGVSTENSFSYQWFVTKMFILALPYINDKTLYDNLINKVKKSLNVLNMLMLNNDTFINYGDNDGGYLFSFDNNYSLGKDIKRYYDFFFNNKKDVEIDLISGLYNYYDKSYQSSKIDIKTNCFYNKNVFIYRKDNNLLFFNAKDIVGHAHNDSLAINLFINGKELICDSGTYCYDNDINKRKYYVSREAHSTILFDTVNARHIGTFRWKNYYKSYIDDVKIDNNIIEVSGLIENICQRRVVIDLNNKTIEIFDKALNNQNISSNWIISNARVTGNSVINDYLNLSIKEGKITSKKTYISKRFLEESEALMCNASSNVVKIKILK